LSIHSFVKTSKDKLQEMGQKSQVLVKSHYTETQEALRYKEVFEKI